MRGKPKFKLGDKVTFTLENKKYEGEICVVDKWGTFFDDSDVYYDIWTTNGTYKHIHEQLINN